MLTKAALINQKYSKNESCEILLLFKIIVFYFNRFKNVMYFRMSSVSQDPSEC